MKWLCIFAAIASFVIESKTSVSTSGSVPEGSQATYECTYKKGQMTAGNSATLTLEGWQDVEIARITLWMKSNKSSGAGSLRVDVDGSEVWRIGDSSFKDWVGNYSDVYVPVGHTFSPAVAATQGNIRIRVEATENSLYIERYEIEWARAAARPYVVSLIEDGVHEYAQITEGSIGEGVVLPRLNDIEDWYFTGWSEVPVRETVSEPTLLLAGTRYYPKHDVRLYAVYADYIAPDLDKRQRLDCQSGYYAIAFLVSSTIKVLAGPVDETIEGINICNSPLYKTEDGWCERQFNITEQMTYYVDFLTDSTAQIIHVLTNSYVGYKNGTLYENDTPWYYKTVRDSTICFYMPYDAVRLRTLMVQYDGENSIWKGGVSTCLDSMLCRQALLYEADPNMGNTYWTSYPYGEDLPHVYETAPNTGETIVHFGIYTLHIRNGKKWLFLGEMY